jgi:hypothetical protein
MLEPPQRPPRFFGSSILVRWFQLTVRNVE